MTCHGRRVGCSPARNLLASSCVVKTNWQFTFIVSKFFQALIHRNNLRLVVAAMFLFVLLAEFGSHVMAHANAPHSQEQLISVTGDSHDEPCSHLMSCYDNRHSNQQIPNSGHQLLPNDLLAITRFVPEIEVNFDPPIPFAQANALYRESSPPFHPPKNLITEELTR